MDRAASAIHTADRALRSLEMLGALPPTTDIERDAATQRFACTFEAVWKAARAVLLSREVVAAASPKGGVRASHSTGFLDQREAEEALVMVDDRSLTRHTYQEDVARATRERLPGYAKVLRSWASHMRAGPSPTKEAPGTRRGAYSAMQ